MSLPRWIVTVAMMLPLSVFAQDKPKAAAADPANATEAGVPLQYESAFAGYQAMGDLTPAPEKTWRAINDEMGRLGGHAGQIRDAATARSKLNVPAPTNAPQDAKAQPHTMAPGHTMPPKSGAQ